jgi:hypothetical protein
MSPIKLIIKGVDTSVKLLASFLLGAIYAINTSKSSSALHIRAIIFHLMTFRHTWVCASESK